MTPLENKLYSLTRFTIGDLVEIDESEIIGAIEGMKIRIGCEDEYLVSYHDAAGSPQRVWWPDSSLEAVEDDETESNVICFACEREARNTTRH
jgi:hypothetical protein